MAESITTDETDYGSIDLKWGEVIEQIFNTEPQEPFTFHFQFLENDVSEFFLSKALAEFLMIGCKIKFNCELAELTPDKSKILHQYLWSIGWDAEYTNEMSTETKDNETYPLMKVNVNFKRCPYSYRK